MPLQIYAAWISADPSSAASLPPPSWSSLDFWIQVILPVALFAVQFLSLIFLIVYVIKTADIAKSNRKAAEATQQAAEATLASVRLSEQTLAEMQATRDAQTSPYVIIYLEMKSLIVDLVLENLGQTVARNIRLSFNPLLQSSRPLPAFVDQETPSLAPKQKMSYTLNSFPELVNNPRLPSRYEVTVKYYGGILETDRQKERVEKFILDVKSFWGTTVPQNKFVKTLDDGLGNITKSLEKTTEAIDEVKEGLDFGLTATAAMSYQIVGAASRDYVAYFKGLVRGLASDWRVWQARKGPDEFLPPQLLEQRFNLSAQAVVAVAPYLSIPDEKIDRIRLLLFDLQATGWNIRMRFDDMSDEVTEKLAELCAITDALEIEPIPKVRQQSRIARSTARTSNRSILPLAKGGDSNSPYSTDLPAE